jgi:hypothetical protein
VGIGLVELVDLLALVIVDGVVEELQSALAARLFGARRR